MQTMKQAAAEFLACKRVAVTGVSREPQGHGSNVVYQRLRQRGYAVFAVNPNAITSKATPASPHGSPADGDALDHDQGRWHGADPRRQRHQGPELDAPGSRVTVDPVQESDGFDGGS